MNDTELRKICYYDEFKCLCGACPDNCCHGWSIPLDEEALSRFKKEKGLYGIWLRSTIHGREQKIFSPLSIRCPHLRRDGYCDLQKKKGEAYIADVCREYPRVRMNYGPAAEFHLDLSCIHAASLFLSHLGEEELLVDSDSEDLPEQYGNNDDQEHFLNLYDHRYSLIALIRAAVEEGADVLNDALRFIAGREWLIQKDLLIKGSSDKWYSDDELDIGRDLFPLSINDINEIMSTCFYEEWLRYSEPFLYKLCRMYYKSFDRLSYKQGDEELRSLFKKYIYHDPAAIRLMGEYVISLLLRRYLMSFEDYSPYHHFKDAYLSMNLLCLFYMLWYEKKGKPEKSDIAHMIAAVEKRFFHNDNVLKDVHASVRSEKAAVTGEMSGE